MINVLGEDDFGLFGLLVKDIVGQGFALVKQSNVAVGIDTDDDAGFAQGIAGTLVYEAGRRAMLEHGLDTLVIIAETDSSPSRLYESVGFRPAEKTVGLLWWDRRETDAPKFERPPAPAAG